MQKPETVFTKTREVSCHGKEAEYDHPLVYLEIKDDLGKIDCPYCGKEFVLER
jgi:uncharacterized Zn-finger protein